MSNIARRLLESGAVLEGPGEGRSRRLLRVNPDAAFALGIQLVRNQLAVGVVDLEGAIRGAAAVAIDGEPPEEIFAGLPALVDAALADAGVRRDAVLGAGIGTPGPLDLRLGTTLNVRNPPSWSHFGVRDAVARVLGLPVIMDNDATAAALGEHWRGAGQRADNFIYLYLGAGFGAGPRARRGRPPPPARQRRRAVAHPGRPGRAAVRVREPRVPGAVPEPGRAAERGAPRRAGARPTAARHVPETVEALFAHEDPRLREVVAPAGAHLARVVADCCRFVDPELIVLGGPLVAIAGPPFAEAIERALERLDEPGAPPPAVELSETGSEAGVVGAATLVLHNLYAPTAHKLSLAGLSGERAA